MATASGGAQAIPLRDDDDVAVAARPIPAGTVLNLGDASVEVVEPIPMGHKLALVDLAEGAPVRKYGQVIGFASKAIRAGSHVHVQNLRADLFERDYAFAT